MSIASEITRINNNIAATYTALSAKGATLPATENSANLASTVATVPSGGSVDPSRLLFEVNNGVASKPSVTFNANSFAGITSVGTYVLSSAYSRKSQSASNPDGIVSFPDLVSIGERGMPSAFEYNNITSVSFPLLTTVGIYALFNAFQYCQSLTSVSFPSVNTVGQSSFYQAFYKCYNLTGNISFPSLTTVTGKSAFEYCFASTTITSVSFPELVTIDGEGAFKDFCANSRVASASFPKLKTIASYRSCYNMFYGDIYLSSVDLSALESIAAGGAPNMFSGCTSLTTISFPSLTTVASNSFGASFFGNCTNLTEIHFPAAIQSDIEATTGYSTKWGASNATIYFDL